MIQYRKAAILLLGMVGAVLPASLPFAQTAGSASPNAPASALGGNEGQPEELTVSLPLKSLLFTGDEIASIQSARSFYEKHHSGQAMDGGIADDDFLKNLEKIAAVKQNTVSSVFTYPQFFLSSIAYYSPGNWVVWVDNEKITQSSGVSASGLQVVGINREKVTLEWTPKRMDKIIAPDRQLADNPVQVDFTGKKVLFSLKPNQTFTSYAMRVVEGKVQPVTVSIKDDAAIHLLTEQDGSGGQEPVE